MIGNTAHNLRVIEQVAEEIHVDHIPKTLLCNVHPLMMFQGKTKEPCQDIHNSLGNKKIIESCLVEVNFKNESFIMTSTK